jgi:cytochrome c oxidase subunit 1/cytochrome c oxidase subunit I+III
MGARAPANPWQAGTLEWAMPSPAPAYNFVVIPTVASRHPLWEDQLRESEGRSHVYRGYELSEAHETIGSTTVDAIPEIILRMPGESLAPLFLAICMAAVFTALLLHFWWGVGAAGLGILTALLVWFWPERHLGQAAPRGGVAAAGGAE